jgi:hypothetical protein
LHVGVRNGHPATTSRLLTVPEAEVLQGGGGQTELDIGLQTASFSKMGVVDTKRQYPGLYSEKEGSPLTESN